MQIDQTPELRATYFLLYGAGARHAAAGLLFDVLHSVAERETIPGRSLLVAMIGPYNDVDGLLEHIRDGGKLPVESLLPLLTPPGRDGRR